MEDEDSGEFTESREERDERMYQAGLQGAKSLGTDDAITFLFGAIVGFAVCCLLQILGIIHMVDI